MILDERLLSRSYGKTILASLPAFSRTRSEAEACAFVQRGGRRDLSGRGAAQGLE
jgi:ATP-dependent DNA helicase DinG